MSWEPILTIAVGVFLGAGGVVVASVACVAVSQWWEDRRETERAIRAAKVYR